jgi:hypothetical protein
MTPAKKVKSCGLTGLDEMSKLSTRPISTLTTWFTTKPELFDVVLSGCVNKKLNQSLADITGLSEHYKGKLEELNNAKAQK